MSAFDPFAVLGLPRVYDVDAAAVERAYLERSAAEHPDMAAQHGLAELGGEPEERIAEINRARQVLADPERRAAALWTLSGGVESREMPPGFLMEMMEVREEIEAAQRSRDAAALAKWGAWAEARRAAHQRTVSGLFAGMAGGTGAEALRKVRMELNAWRYVERLVEQMGE